MKIKIRKDIVSVYQQEGMDDYEWEETLSKISGKTLEVDTDELFKYEFNTKPIKGVSEEGLRIFDNYVEEVIDDIRPGKARCDLCNETSMSDEVCSNCGRSDYLEPFTDCAWA